MCSPVSIVRLRHVTGRGSPFEYALRFELTDDSGPDEAAWTHDESEM